MMGKYDLMEKETGKCRIEFGNSARRVGKAVTAQGNGCEGSRGRLL